MSERFLCVHAHFYQPPRENPWLEAIEVQESAYPYHDWNERVLAECYAPNAACRILDGEGRITDIVNNYSKLSFNIGPTLLAWMEAKAPKTYAAVQAADRESSASYSGHGSALAQAYNHMILPLANARDKSTQVLWGIRDFEHRFGRLPEGMWLPEAAVDVESLDALAAHGISFTILSPHSAKRVRPIGGRAWRDVSGGRIDPSMPYKLRLPSGQSIHIFFYDGPVSHAVAFEKLLAGGEDFANRLASAFSDSRSWPQIVHIATDGETYGHHYPHGDMALAYALRYIESKQLARLTNYGEFLEKHPPNHEVQVHEKSSWSCPHGVERWHSNCGCSSGMNPGWNQEWRKPLREAMDWLRDALIPIFEQTGSQLFQDPWRARDDYIQVVLNRSTDNVNNFLNNQAAHDLNDEERTRALALLEMQRHAMLMYTSCGWFFDELSGLETVQVIQYAARALQLGQGFHGEDRQRQFQDRLERAKSNLQEYENGRRVYEKLVAPVMLDLPKAGAHYAISFLFEHFEPQTHMYCYSVRQEEVQERSSGKTRLAVGRIAISSDITWESTRLSFGVVHLGDHNITGGVRVSPEEKAYQDTLQEVIRAFDKADLPELIRVVDKAFGVETYTLKLLFRDEQRKIVHQILDSALKEAEATYRQLYENLAPLMRFVSELNMPQIRQFQAAAEFTLNADLRKAIEAETMSPQATQALLDQAKRANVLFDVATLEFALRHKLEQIAERFQSHPDDLFQLQALEAAADLARSVPFEVQLWEVQNIYFGIMKEFYPRMRESTSDADQDAKEWVRSFRSLGEKLSVHVE